MPGAGPPVRIGVTLLPVTCLHAVVCLKRRRFVVGHFHLPDVSHPWTVSPFAKALKSTHTERHSERCLSILAFFNRA
jgi:hypothetical protein